MKPDELLQRLEERGVSLRMSAVRSGLLIASNGHAITADLAADIRENKSALIEIVTQRMAAERDAQEAPHGRCPEKHPLTSDWACWKCNYRKCKLCDRNTVSCFIQHCLICERTLPND